MSRQTPMLFQDTLQILEDALARLCLPFGRERGLLLSFLIHGVFASKEEAQCGLVDPQQGFTVGMLRDFLEHFTREGYRFLAPPDLARELCPREKYVLLTFDDGYFNNTRTLPLLEAFNVPAVFFISSEHVKRGKAFWWDAVYRESKKRRRPSEELSCMVAEYKKMKTPQIEADIRSRFGSSALSPVSDLDRPFSAAELKRFAMHRLVFLGNHTRDHAILANYSVEGVREQIAGCQQVLRHITGKAPQIIAYPNGNCSEAICEAACRAGLRFGLLAAAGRNRLPLDPGTPQAMTLKRFTLWGNRPVEAQCRASQSWISVHRFLKFLQRDLALKDLPYRSV